MKAVGLTALALLSLLPIAAQAQSASCVHPSTAPEASIRACLKAPKRPDAHYTLGQLYLETKQLDQAASTFASFAQTYPSDPRAVYAGRLHLESLNLAKRHSALEQAAYAYSRGTSIRDPKFLREVTDIAIRARFRRCTRLEPAHQDSLDCHLELRREHPGHKVAPIASFNASVAMLRRRQLDQAAGEFTYFLSRYPNSKYEPQVLLMAANVAHKRFAFETSAMYFERLSLKYPKERASQDALLEAARLREATGEWAKAARLYRRYAALYGRKQDVSAVLERLAKLYHEHGRVKDAQNLDRRLFRDPKMPRVYRARAGLRSVTNASPPPKRKTLRTLELTLKMLTEMPERPEVLELRGEAMFLRAKLRRGQGAGLQESIQALQGVLKTRSTRWSLRAAAELGALYEGAAKPSRTCDRVCVQKMRAKALAAYQMAAKRGHALGLYTEAHERALEGLERVGDMRPLSERVPLGDEVEGMRSVQMIWE